jgi:O-succinylbenzoate synthase
MKLRIEKHQLHFIKPAKTSRGSYTEKTAHLLVLETPSGSFSGEVSPLPDLSIDGKADFEHLLHLGLSQLNKEELEIHDLMNLQEEWSNYPALRFGLNCIISDLFSIKSDRGIELEPYSDFESNPESVEFSHLTSDFHERTNNQPISNHLRTRVSDTKYSGTNNFLSKKSGIPINGLVWMNDIDSMEEEANQKINAGFKIIKFKVGALDFDAECRLFERIRKKHSAFDLEIRLDANGAFSPDTALEQLGELSRFEIHSLEQPIRANNWDDMQKICALSPIDIALDEELIGYSNHNESELREDARKLLQYIKPKYIILKPTFIGGLDRCDIWAEESWKNEIGWWSTSALEGNIGLFAIAKWASKYMNHPKFMVQGLGTGSLFVKNFPANTEVKNGHLYAL